jgi:hypothetical protein
MFSSGSSFRVGDRVVVHSLLKASHLNGRHGCIAGEIDTCTGRYPVDLDTWVHRVMAKDVNLEREPLCSDDDEEEKTEKDGFVGTLRVANVNPKSGTLVESEARPIGLVLDAARFLVGSVLHQDPDIQCGLIDIEQLRQDGNYKVIQALMDTAWAHWEDASPYSTPDNQNLYQLVQQFFRDLPKANAGHKMPTEFYAALASLKHRTAVRGWSNRVQGEFWVVACNGRTGGTYLVPKTNLHLVYHVFGVRSSLRRLVDPNRPRLLKATLLPWYGRLVCDEAIPSTTAEMPENALAKELKHNIQLARQEGRIVEKLRQLEMPQTSKQASLHHPTPRELHFLRQLVDLPVAPPGEAIWCMRRRGYTEDDNPHHTGVIINGVGGIAVGPFSCSALEPTAADILQALVAYCGGNGESLPPVLLIDDLKCYQRMNHLLKSFSIDVDYYPPPTPEETAEALNSH